MLNIRLVKGLSKPELSKHITPSLILGHDECMRGNNITAFIQRALNTWRGRLQHFLQVLNSKINKKMIVI